MTQTTPSDEALLREAGRVLLMDDTGHLLLISCRNPATGDVFWITPGGGCEPGETHAEAALRELHEETGLTGLELGPCVWRRRHVFPWLGRVYDQRERFHVCRVSERPEVVSHQPTEDELMTLGEFRWWRLEEIETAGDTVFAPRYLGRHLRALLEGGVPAEPIDVSDQQGGGW